MNQNNDKYKIFKSFKLVEQANKNDTVRYYSDNFILTEITWNNENKIYYNNKTILSYNSEKTSILIEQFDKNFIIVSECIPNSMVATPIQLKRKKIWILDANSNKVYSIEVNNILIDSEKKVRRINGIPHHVNSAFGLVSIDTSNLKISLLKATQEIINLDLALVNHPN